MSDQANNAGVQPAAKPRYPAGIAYIVGNEGAERFSYYGMRAVLYAYLVSLYLRFDEIAGLSPDQIAAAEAQATKVTHLFFAGVYLFPLIGAILSDRLLGKYRVILWVSLLYCAGHAVLAVAGRMGAMGNYSGAEIGMYVGLALIAVGAGGIKPCVSANVGDQFTADNGELVTRIFQIFYFIINFGSFLSNIITPLLDTHFSAEVAFGVPGILMGIATLVFWMGRNKFVKQPPKPGGKLGGIDFVATVLLLSPIFTIILGYFVFWENFQSPTGGHGLDAVGPFFASHWWLLVATAASFGVGYGLFMWRQKIEEDNGFLAVLVHALRTMRQRKPGQGFFDSAREKFGEEAGDGPPAVLKIVVVFSMVSVFWALFDQHASTWLLQAKAMDRTVILPEWTAFWVVATAVIGTLFGGTWVMLHVANIDIPRKVIWGLLALVVGGFVVSGIHDAAMSATVEHAIDYRHSSALNPLLVMIIIPLLNVAVWGPLKKRGIEVKPLVKMSLGMFLAALAFGMTAVVQMAVEGSPGSVHVFWQVPQYWVMTSAEVLVSVTGLEFAYTQAPRAMKSTIMGFWLVCVTFGNLIVAFLAPLQKTFALSEFFWVFAGLMVVAAVLFTVMAYFYKGKTYLQTS